GPGENALFSPGADPFGERSFCSRTLALSCYNQNLPMIRMADHLDDSEIWETSMGKLLRFVLVLAFLANTGLFSATPASAQSTVSTGECLQGTFATKAIWLICIPTLTPWNHDLVVYAHGYTAPNAPVGLQNLSLPDGTSVPDMVLGLGYAFATTSYRQNGLTILDGTQDILDVVTQFHALCKCEPGHTYLTGVSEGGLITTLLMERDPQVFSGGLAACGPVGSFQKQVNYFGDFRVLFDYFFPNVLPPSPIAIPNEVMTDWTSKYVPLIASQIQANPSAAKQLISTSKAAIDLFNPSSNVQTAEDVLWYNAFATNDAAEKLGGNPFDNHDRFYWGSANDLLLNLRVERFKASPTALANLRSYETTGHLTKPLVTLHTVGDDVIPFWQEIVYYEKVKAAGDTKNLTPIPIFAYGHCNFTGAEVLLSFDLLVNQVTGHPISGQTVALNPAQAQQNFDRARREVAPQMPR
ncbi:MAG TPA: hypothetical protein VMW65_16670, partial [Chloroflexota bacterium]|nr:hypothetical protein [Chloroflexota bacterium]